MSEYGTTSQQGRAGAADGVLRGLLANSGGKSCPPQLPPISPPTPGRAAAVAAGRAASRLFGIKVQPLDIQPGVLSLAEMPELLPEPALLAVLEGPDEALGVMALSAEAVTALVEVQALGRLTSRPTERRRPTRSDAMLCADFINMLLTELARELTVISGFETWTGYRYASYLDDPRPLALMLEDAPFRSLAMKLHFNKIDDREVMIFIALPQPETLPQPTPPPDSNSDPTPSDRSAPELTVPGPVASIGTAPVSLQGILTRRRISLRELRALVPDRILSLPQASLDNVRLETTTGQLLATGRLGEAEGCHAIRLHDPHAGHHLPDPPGPSHRNHPPISDLAMPDPFREPPPSEDLPHDQTAESPRSLPD